MGEYTAITVPDESLTSTVEPAVALTVIVVAGGGMVGAVGQPAGEPGPEVLGVVMFVGRLVGIGMGRWPHARHPDRHWPLRLLCRGL